MDLAPEKVLFSGARPRAPYKCNPNGGVIQRSGNGLLRGRGWHIPYIFRHMKVPHVAPPGACLSSPLRCRA